MVIPFLFGNFSCSNKNLNVTSLDDNSELISTISGVAALGQLVPMGEVRKLASPISQLGSFPRVQEILVKEGCLLYTSPSPRDRVRSRMPSSA